MLSVLHFVPPVYLGTVSSPPLQMQFNCPKLIYTIKSISNQIKIGMVHSAGSPIRSWAQVTVCVELHMIFLRPRGFLRVLRFPLTCTGVLFVVYSHFAPGVHGTGSGSTLIHQDTMLSEYDHADGSRGE